MPPQESMTNAESKPESKVFYHSGHTGRDPLDWLNYKLSHYTWDTRYWVNSAAVLSNLEDPALA